MTRSEARDRTIELFDKGYAIESELRYENRWAFIFASHTGYKWLVEYTKNENGWFTPSDVRLFDAITESYRDTTNDGKFIAYNTYNI